MSSLFNVARLGYLHMVRKYIAEGQDPQELVYVHSNYWAAIHGSCQGNHILVVKYLIEEAGVDINLRTKMGATPLIIAASYDSMDVVKYLVESKANLIAKNETDLTALHVAAVNGCSKIVQYFVKDLKMDMECKTTYGWTPLMHAAVGGDYSTVKILVDMRANIFTKAKSSMTALDLAKDDRIREYLKGKCLNAMKFSFLVGVEGRVGINSSSSLGSSTEELNVPQGGEYTME